MKFILWQYPTWRTPFTVRGYDVGSQDVYSLRSDGSTIWQVRGNAGGALDIAQPKPLRGINQAGVGGKHEKITRGKGLPQAMYTELTLYNGKR